ncbi:hypothetical protein, variant [Puccinia triticina 1-1 BBBD Race 1]|uniref:Uncharacterized protein n=2 Tax=Puccinia triticina TaxID=208348 RepID=A0A0C4EPU1_PUCT1|nr:hypothetical protein PTTG_02794 [Puccinia triticina 1-1 BBBD Race 1]OAV92972.1 hypothetical protein, variant [Puccinia triticina 1-1 BBBD Race 1]
MATASSANPLLEYQPAYTYSMPTQLLILGIVLTLLTVLLLHLLFTAKYHYPLAPCNFILLFAAVILTHLSTIILVILTNIHLFNRSRYWPFMFDYIEVTMPMTDWNLVPLAGWYIMQGAVTFLAHATHIQFLTLLFPSTLERRLILAFLGPLCVFASVLFFTHFLSDPNYQDLGDAIRNTATSTLSLLYTFGLLIWGYVVNRKRAWEFEGGTFGFGAMSISLALVGTAANFIEVREDRLKWLPWLVNTVLLWQSWAGFWWWVGAGMWSGEVQDIERREDKKRRREEKRQRKRSKMFNLISNLTQSSRDLASTSAFSPTLHHHHDSSAQSINLVRSPSSRLGSATGASRASTILRRFPSSSRQEEDPGRSIELDVLSPRSSNRACGERDMAEAHLRSHATEASSSTNDTPTTGRERRGMFSFIRQPGFLRHWLGTLSQAHNEAAKQQARTAGVDQVKRFGIRAMTQKVIQERTTQQQQHRSPVHSPSSLSIDPRRSRQPPQRGRRATAESDSDWVSDDEPASTLHHRPLSGPSTTPSYPLSPALHHYPAQPQYQSLPKSSPHCLPSHTLNLGLRLEDQPLPALPAPSSANDPRQRHLPDPADDHRPPRSWKRPLVKAARLRDVTRYD